MVIVHYCLKNALLHSGVSVEKTPIRYSWPLSTTFQQKYFSSYWSLWPVLNLISCRCYTSLCDKLCLLHCMFLWKKKINRNHMEQRGSQRKILVAILSQKQPRTVLHLTEIKCLIYKNRWRIGFQFAQHICQSRWREKHFLYQIILRLALQVHGRVSDARNEKGTFSFLPNCFLLPPSMLSEWASKALTKWNTMVHISNLQREGGILLCFVII